MVVQLRCVPIIVSLVLLMGCSTDRSNQPDTTLISVGKVVEVPSSALDDLPIWQFSVEPDLSIGVSEGEEPYMFHRIATASKLLGGEYLVVDKQSRELRVFDSSGSFLRKYGGRGQGPGEFGSIRVVGSVDRNRIGILDFNLRITVYDLAEGLISSKRFPNTRYPGTERTPGIEGGCSLEGVFADGNVVAALNVPDVLSDLIPPEIMTTRPVFTRRYAVYRDRAFSEIDSIFTETRIEYRERPSGMRERYWGTEALFTPKGVVSFGATGMIIATSDRFEIRHFSSIGQALKTIRVLKDPVPVTNVLLRPSRVWIDTVSSIREPARKYVRDYKPEGDVPFFEDLFLDKVGRIWVQNYRTSPAVGPEYPRSWIVFSDEGWPIAQIAESFPGSILEIGEDYVLALDEGPLGVQTVVEYRIEPDE